MSEITVFNKNQNSQDTINETELQEDYLFTDKFIGFKERFDLFAIAIYVIAIPLLIAYYLLMENTGAINVINDMLFFLIIGAIYPVIFFMKNHEAESEPIDFSRVIYGGIYILGGIMVVVVLSFVLSSTISNLLHTATVPSAELSPIDSFVLEFLFIIPVEEMFFRGTIVYFLAFILSKQPNLGKNTRYAIIITVSAIAFGIMHYPKYALFYSEYVDSGAVLYIIIELIVLGAFCTFIALKFGIFNAIILHTINNALATSGTMTDILSEHGSSIISIILILLTIVILLVSAAKSSMKTTRILRFITIVSVLAIITYLVLFFTRLRLLPYMCVLAAVIVPLYMRKDHDGTAIVSGIMAGFLISIFTNAIMIASGLEAFISLMESLFFGLCSIFTALLLSIIFQHSKNRSNLT